MIPPDGEVHSGVLSGTTNIAANAPTILDALRVTNIFQGFTSAVCHKPRFKLAKTGDSAQNAALGCVVSQKLRERTDRFHLIFPQSTQIILTEPILVQESPQYILKSRTTRVVFVVDVFTAFGQVPFQFP
jgi:hypothetical protein